MFNFFYMGYKNMCDYWIQHRKPNLFSSKYLVLWNTSVDGRKHTGIPILLALIWKGKKNWKLIVALSCIDNAKSYLFYSSSEDVTWLYPILNSLGLMYNWWQQQLDPILNSLVLKYNWWQLPASDDLTLKT